MDVDTNFETCLFLSSHKLAIGVYEKQSLKKLFYNEIQNNQNSSNLNHELLNNFLEKMPVQHANMQNNTNNMQPQKFYEGYTQNDNYYEVDYKNIRNIRNISL